MERHSFTMDGGHNSQEVAEEEEMRTSHTTIDLYLAIFNPEWMAYLSKKRRKKVLGNKVVEEK